MDSGCLNVRNDCVIGNLGGVGLCCLFGVFFLPPEVYLSQEYFVSGSIHSIHTMEAADLKLFIRQENLHN